MIDYAVAPPGHSDHCKCSIIYWPIQVHEMSDVSSKSIDLSDIPLLAIYSFSAEQNERMIAAAPLNKGAFLVTSHFECDYFWQSIHFSYLFHVLCASQSTYKVFVHECVVRSNATNWPDFGPLFGQFHVWFDTNDASSRPEFSTNGVRRRENTVAHMSRRRKSSAKREKMYQLIHYTKCR